MRNEMEICFDAISENESFARIAVAAFLVQQNPTLEEVTDIKTAVSEAVTNSIIHGYEGVEGGKVKMRCILEEDELLVEVVDRGRGIENIEQAMEPLYTSKPEQDRSGMGFSFMEAFMDELEVESLVGRGTLVRMRKRIGAGPGPGCEE